MTSSNLNLVTANVFTVLKTIMVHASIVMAAFNLEFSWYFHRNEIHML